MVSSTDPLISSVNDLQNNEICSNSSVGDPEATPAGEFINILDSAEMIYLPNTSKVDNGIITFLDEDQAMLFNGDRLHVLQLPTITDLDKSQASAVCNSNECTLETLQISNSETEYISETEYEEQNSDLLVEKIPAKDQTNTRSDQVKRARKKNHCIFCKQLKTNMSRHFILVHSDEREVREILSLDKMSAERLRLIGLLRQKGNFEFNRSLKEDDGNNMILARRRKNKAAFKGHKGIVPCPLCRKFISAASMPRHRKTCLSDIESSATSLTKNGRALLTHVHPAAQQVLLAEIIPPMHRDTIFHVLRQDKLIILYANHLLPKFAGHQQYIIRNKMRSAARLLIILRKDHPKIEQFYEFFQPKYFENVMSGIQEYAGYNTSIGHFERPKSALEMVQTVQTCCRVLLSTCIIEGKEDMKEKITNFKTLLETQAPGRINKPASKTMIDLRRKKHSSGNEKIPLTSDVNNFKSYIIDEARKVWRSLNINGFTYINWLKLSELCLLYLVIFNKKRTGESARAKLEDFLNVRKLCDTSLPEVYENLTAKEKEQSSNIYKMVLRGKLDRSVTAFFTEEMRNYLEYLCENRSNACIPTDNPYLFALPGIKTGNRFRVLDACQLFTKYSKCANISEPEKMRSIPIRKHFATRISTLSLPEQQQEVVQNFMGHEGKIHKGYYRKTIVSQDLFLAKILEDNSHTNETADNTDSTTMNEETVTSSKSPAIEHEYYRSSYYGTPAKRLVLSDKKKNRDDRPVKNPTVRRKLLDELSDKTRNSEIYRLCTAKKPHVLLERHPICTSNPRATENSSAPSVSDRAHISCVSQDTATTGECQLLYPFPTNYPLIEPDSVGNSVSRRRWDTPAKKRMCTIFAREIATKSFPKGTEIRNALMKYPELEGRTHTQVRSFLQHIHKKS